MTLRNLFLPSLFLAALGQSAYCVITINNDSASLSAPSSGAPWDYVARLDDGFGARASGIYLGNGYVLTANHVDNDINQVFLDGANFTLDGSFTPVAIAGTDMRIMRLAEDPGLPMLPLITSSESAFSKAATMIGWGVGKGTVVANQGWNWADDTTRVERWGTGTTLGTYATDQSGVTYLQTTFDKTKGASTGQLTGGDSGGGLFVNFNGVWTLVGVNASVDTDNAALYDNNLLTAGNQPDHSYFASVTQFTAQIEAIVGPMAVGGLVQYWDGAGAISNGVIDGGAGTWNTTGTNWTNSGGSINLKWQGGTAVFGGPAGTVTLGSAISAEGLTFNTAGYTISGTNTLTLAGTAPEIDVTNAGDSATISAKLAGTAGLKVGGAGTLILTNTANSYTGATQVSTGTLQIGSATAAGNISSTSAVTLSQGGMLSLTNVNGGTFANNVTAGIGGGTVNINSANATTLSGALTDNGTDLLAVTQSGTGMSILTNAHNTYSGATTISAGTLQIGSATAAGSVGANSAINVANSGALSLVNASGNTLGNSISGAGLVNGNTAGSVTLSGLLSDNNGALRVMQSGSGTLVLSNPNNSYSGGTTLNGGTLIVNGSTADGSGSPLGTGTLTINGGTLGTTVQPASGTTGTIISNLISLHGNFSIATNSNPASFGAQNITLAGPIDLNGATRTITGVTNGGQVHFSYVIGAIGETAGVNFNTSFTKSGDYVAFILDPSNVNNYTGLTTVNNGAFLVLEGATSEGAIRGNLDIEGTGSVDYIAGSGSAPQIADTATVTVNATGNTLSGLHFDGLELRGASDTIGALNGTGSVGLGNGTLTVGAGNFSGLIEDGAFATAPTSANSPRGSLTKNTSGTFTLSGTTTFSGNLTVNDGTLILSGKNAYGGQTIVNGGTLRAGAANILPGYSPLTVTAPGTFDLNGFSQSVATIFGSGNVTLGTATLTLGATGLSSTFTGSISGTGGVTKVGPGTFALAGTNTYTGPTNVVSGIFMAVPSGTTPVLSASSALVLGGNAAGGAGFELFGVPTTTTSQVLNGLTVNAGRNIIVINTGAGATTTLDLRGLSGTAGITRNTDGFVDFGVIGGGMLGVDAIFLTSQPNNTAGIIGGWATVNGGTDFATNRGGKIVGLSTVAGGYTSIGATFDTIPNGSNLNVAMNMAVGLFGSSVNDVLAIHPVTAINTLAQNIGTASTVNLQGGTLQMGSDGGILVTTIGNNLTIGATPNDGVFTAATTSSSSNSISLSNNSQLSTPGILTINSSIRDNGSTHVSVRITGNKTTVFTGTNTYTGMTDVLNGTLQTNANQALGNNSAVVVNTGATLNLNNTTQNVGSIADGPNGGGTINFGSGSPSIGSLVTGGNNTSTAFSGIIAGIGNLTKTGTGALTLSGANTYTGNTTLTNGGLILNSSSSADGSSGPLGASSGTLIIAPGTGNTVTIGSTVNNTALTNPISVQGNFSVSTAGLGQNLYLIGNMNLGGVTRTITGVTNGGQPQFGNISNGGVTLNTSFTKDGDYVAFIYNGTNTYTGLTTVNNGAILVFQGNSVDGGVAGNLDIEGNGVVDYIMGSNSAYQIADTATVTVNSSGNSVGGSHFDGLELRGAQDAIGILNGKGRIGLGSGALWVQAGNFTGVIEDGAFGTRGNLVKFNTTGTLVLSGKNTYTGVTLVSEGTLQAGAVGTIPIASVVGVAPNAVLDLHGFNQSIGSLSDPNTTGDGGTVLLGKATLTTGFDGMDRTFSGAIQGTGGLIKVGTGGFDLAGANTYTGATNVTGGILQVDGSLAAASVVNVGTAGRLDGSGNIHGKVTLTGNGVINLSGGGTIGGTLTITGGNWTGSGTVNGAVTSSSGTFTIGNGAILIGNAGLNVTGGQLAGTGNLAANLNYTSSTSSTFAGVIQNNAGASSVTMNKASATLTLTGVSNYSGSTNISAGTLQIGDGTSGGLTGTGPVNISGTGTLALDLPGGNTFFQNVFLNAPGASLKSISSTLVDVTGDISGKGSVNQNGTGFTSLQGNNTYTGATNINAGILSIDGSTAAGSTVKVGTAGTLSGIGAIHGNVTLTGNGSIYLDTPAVIGGTLTATGGNWVGGGTVNGKVTSSSGVFNIVNGATLTANSGVALTGGSLSGTGTIAGSLTDTSSTSSTFAGVISGATSSVTMNKASATLTLTGANTYGGATNISAGTLQIGDGNSGGLTGSGPVNVSGTGTLALDLPSGNPFSQNVFLNTTGANVKFLTTSFTQVSGVISGKGGVNQNGPGITSLTGVNTYTGVTNVNAGILSIDGSTAAASTVKVGTAGQLIGTGVINGNVTMTGGANISLQTGAVIGGTLAVTGGTWGLDGAVNGKVTSSSGIFNIANGAMLTANSGVNVTGGTLAGTGTINGSLTYASTTSTFGGTIIGANSSVTMNKASNTFTLTGTNTYEGGTNITAGTLQVGDGLNLGATLGDWAGIVTTAGTGTLTTNLANFETFSNLVTNNGHFIATGTTSNYSIASTISGTGNFTKNGTNTVTLTGNNSTYKGGTVINAGTLLVDNHQGLGTGTGTVTVNKGATLGGFGTVGAVTLNSGGILAPGAGSPGVSGTTLLATSLMWNAGGTLSLQLGVPGDELVLTGALTKGSGSGLYTINILDAGLSTTSYTLAHFASTTFSLANFTLNLPNGDIGSLQLTGTSLILDVTTVNPPTSSEKPSSALVSTSVIGSPDAGGTPTVDLTSSQLSADFGSDSSGSSSPTLVATPEPAGIGLLAFSVLPLLGGRRRRAR